jgi:hypothetical protein
LPLLGVNLAWHVPILVGLPLVALGLCSIWFGLFVTPRP